MDGYALIVPEPGKEKETLRALLALADKPRHVKISSDDGGYLVPEALAEKFNTTGVEEPEEPESASEEPGEQVAPKRRGRPPGSRNKTAPAADDKDGEE